MIIAVCSLNISRAIAQSPDVLGYQVAVRFSGQQTLGANGRFVHQEGNEIVVELTPVFQTPTGRKPKPSERLTLAGKVMFDDGRGVFIRFAESGLCAVMFENGALTACQTRPAGGTRELTEQERAWVRFDGKIIRDFLQSVSEESAEARGKSAPTVSRLPSPLVPKFLADLARDFGEDSNTVIAARATWKTTSRLVGIDDGAIQKAFAEAVQKGSPELVEDALAKGAQIDAPLPSGQSAIEIAVATRNPALVRLLIDRGAATSSAQLLESLVGDAQALVLFRMITAEAEARQEKRTLQLERARDEALAVAEVARNELDAKDAQVSALTEKLDRTTDSLNVLKKDAARLLDAHKKLSDLTTSEAERVTDHLNTLEEKFSKLSTNLYRTKKSVEALKTLVDTTSEKAVWYVQNRLLEFAYDVGEADGKFGERTRNAIRAFERASGWPVTGEITPGLISVLARYAD